MRITSHSTNSIYFQMPVQRPTEQWPSSAMELVLELMAALIGARLSNFITNTIKVSPSMVYLWTDSQIVLYWLQSEKRLNQFVSHRVTEILQLTTTASWRYCPTGDNPADLLTRGITSAQLQSSSLWCFGPQWLTTRDHWPAWQPSATLHLQAAVVSTSEFVPVTASSTQPSLQHIIDLSTIAPLARCWESLPMYGDLYRTSKTNSPRKPGHSQQPSYTLPR